MLSLGITSLRRAVSKIRRKNVRYAVTKVRRRDSTHKLILSKQIAMSEKQSLNTE